MFRESDLKGYIRRWIGASIQHFERADLFSVLALILFPLVLFYPAAFGQVFADGDMSRFSFPAGLELTRALQQGRLPLWTTAMQSGFPLLAEGNIASLYPLNLFLFRFFPVSIAISYTILLHLMWSSVGMYLLARAWKLKPPSALLGAFAYGYGGFAMGHISHLSLTIVAAWLPWLIFLQEKYWRTRSMIWLGLTSIALGLQFLGGFPQLEVINTAIFLVFGISGNLLWRKTIDGVQVSWRETILVTIVPILLGLGLGAAQLIPTAELISQSTRGAEQGIDFITSFSLPLDALGQFLSPFSFAEPSVLNQEYWAYLGIVPIMLAVLALFLRPNSRTIFLFLIALIALSLSLGYTNPLYGIVSYIPIFNRFRVPARFLLPFEFATALLAASSLEKMIEKLRDSSFARRIGWMIAAASSIGVIALVVLQSQLGIPWLELWKTLPWIFAIIGLGVLALAHRSWIHQSIFCSMIIGLTILDLTMFAFPFQSTVARMAPASELTQAPLAVGAMDSQSSLYRMFTNIYNETLRPNHQIVYGKESVQAYLSLPLQRNEDYFFKPSSAMLDAANVRYYILPSGELPSEFAEPTASTMLDLFQYPQTISPVQVTQIEIVSYTDQTADLADGQVAGELVLTTPAKDIVFPIRLGIETADWAQDGFASSQIKHVKPPDSLNFSGYLLSLRHSFEGHKYIAHFTLSLETEVIGVSARSKLSTGKLFIESVSLINQNGVSHASRLNSLIHRNNYDLVFKSHAVAVYENRDALPRAFITHQAKIVSDEQILAQMRQPDFDPQQIVFLNAGQALENRSNAAADQAVITTYEPERVVVRVNSAQPGYLVLSDSFYPGWQATLDGEATPIYRADYIFRAVSVPPGEHTIIFDYKPLSFFVGAIISIVSLTAMIAMIVWGFRKREKCR